MSHNATPRTQQRDRRIHHVILLIKTSKLLDVRAVAPEFRLTRNAYFLLGLACLLISMLLGLFLTFFVIVAPTLFAYIGESQHLVPSLLSLGGIYCLTRHLLKISGRTAREINAPADATILTHAGFTRGQLFTARLILPLTFETLLMVIALCSYSIIAIWNWEIPAHIILKPLLIGVLLSISGGLFRGTALCLLATGRTSMTTLRVLLWSFFLYGAGSIFAGVLLPIMMGENSFREAIQKCFAFLLSEQGTITLLSLTLILLGVSAAALIRLRHKIFWNNAPIDSAPTYTTWRIPLPQNAWRRLIALPLTITRDATDGESGEFLISARITYFSAAFCTGMLVNNTVIEPFLPAEAAWGIAMGAPLLSTGVAHGICSVNAYRPLLPHLTASLLGERGVASAIVCSTTLVCAPLSLLSLPLLLLISSVSASSLLIAWLTGILISPALTLWVDCLFPGRLPSQSNGRIRQNPIASTLVSVIAGIFALIAYALLHQNTPLYVLPLISICLTTLFTLTARIPRKTL
ncbi:hypothetical protein ACN08X_04660 [Rothia sp. P6271]|uniref:hypothetical protein n=1 Tax=Rothia sp. P6271 TaxID=3402659 RepID=UPI003AC6CF0E